MFGSIFKSKETRERERSFRIKQALRKHERHITDLEKHERQYMEKAVRAKKAGDAQNLQILCGMIAQTMNQRKAIQSQLLHFETLVQTRDRINLIHDLSGAMKALNNSVSQMFRDFNPGELMKGLDATLMNAEQMTEAMDMVIDRIATSGINETNQSEGVSADDIMKIIGNQAVAEERSDATQNSLIDENLKQIERMLSGIKS